MEWALRGRPLAAVLLIAWTTMVTLEAHAQVVQLPVTGQTAVVEPGDDGDYGAGTAWPEGRFVDNGDGTISDTLTGLMWLADANCIASSYPIFDAEETPSDGAVSWQSGLSFVASINDGTDSACAGTSQYDDWRMPNILELESLVHAGKEDSAVWLVISGFSNVQSSYHWSSTTRHVTTPAKPDKLVVDLVNGAVTHAAYGVASKSARGIFVLPVRGATSTMSGVPITGQVECYDPELITPCPGTGQDGEYGAGVAWPPNRFVDNGDGTITDTLTGLMWAKNASQLTSRTLTQALGDVASINDGSGTLGYNDWRLPNKGELLSLVDFGTAAPLLPSVFTNVSGIFWTSTSPASGGGAFALDSMGSAVEGLLTVRTVASKYNGMIVRGGAIDADLSIFMTVYDLGDVVVGETEELVLTFVNEGSAALTFGTISPSTATPSTRRRQTSR